MKGLTLISLLLLAGCSQSSFAEAQAKVEATNVVVQIQKMEQACNEAQGAYQVQQMTVPTGETKFQFLCTNVQKPAPQPVPDTNKVQAP